MAPQQVWRSPHPDVEVGGSTLPQFLLEHAGSRPDKPAVIDGPSGRTITYGQLATTVERAAAGFAARDVGPGSVVAMLVPNIPEFPVVLCAAMAAGATVTTVNPLYTAEELAHHLQDAGARLLVTVPPFLPVARPAAEKVSAEVIVIGEGGRPAGTRQDGAVPFASLLGAAGAGAGPTVVADPDRDVALLPYSSGTTGLPKGVELTHANLITNVRQTDALVPVTADDVALAVAPFFHAIGLSSVLHPALRNGATVVTQPRFDLEQFLQLIQDYRVTRSIIVPPIILGMARHPAVDRYDLSSLRLLGSGGAPLSLGLENECAERLGCAVLQGWGMTELTAVGALNPIGAVRHGSVGQLVPNMQARVVDNETGVDLEAGEVGELWVRGPNRMRGYRNRSEATAATVTTDGWLRTGDLGYIDADGYLWVTDRLKELIKYKGFQVAPAELEGLVVSHPAVADVAVVPRHDEAAGEIPVAYVVRNRELTGDELMAWVAERVAPHKRIRAVEFTDEIPKSLSGKLLRRVLVDLERARNG